MLIGPDETSTTTVLDEPVASKVLMLADATAFTSMLHEVAVHVTVPPKSILSATALTPPAVLAVIEPDDASVRSVAADRSTFPP